MSTSDTHATARDKNIDQRQHKDDADNLPRGYPALYDPQAGARRSVCKDMQPKPLEDGRSKFTVMRWDLRSDVKKLSNPPQYAVTNPFTVNAEKPLPDPAVWSSNLVRAILDALGGRRDLSTVRRWIDPQLYRRLAARATSQPPGEPTVPVKIRTVRTCQLDATRIESAVIVEDQGHVRAAAIRLEAFRGRWRVTALEIG